MQRYLGSVLIGSVLLSLRDCPLLTDLPADICDEWNTQAVPDVIKLIIPGIKFEVEEEEQHQPASDQFKKGTKVGIVERLGDTVCGAYLAVDSVGKKWIFKPTGEEGRTADLAVKRGCEWGDSTRKEEAAYALGKQCGVPETMQGEAEVDGVIRAGSLQAYVPNLGSSEDFGASNFSIEEVQKIAALDLRLLNLDRHEGNMLVSEDRKLVPIDHGFCLPSHEDTSDVYFAWQFWSQTRAAVTDNVRRLIEDIDVVEDARTLQRLGISLQAIIASVFATLLLKSMVSKGFSLRDVADVITSLDPQQPSKFQRVLDSLSLGSIASWPWQHGNEQDLAWRAVQAQFLSSFTTAAG